MRHILFIDDIEDLVIKKDSSLLLGIFLSQQITEVYLLFKRDFYYYNYSNVNLTVYSFEGRCFRDSCYIDYFHIGASLEITLGDHDIIHMRLDPPFDARYLRYLWMLQGLETTGATVVNSPVGIMSHNEKLFAYTQKNSCPSFVGESFGAAQQFINLLKNDGYSDLILKPVDLFQGIGVEKLSINKSDLEKFFYKRVREYGGPLIIQPYIDSVEFGEVRSIYFNGQELGTILKIPQKGGFLANIASGATYKSWEMSKIQKQQCDQISKSLIQDGVDWIAFDILGNSVSEVNITCPGLLVEVAEACGQNVVEGLVNLLINKNL